MAFLASARAQLGDYIDEIFFYTSSELSDSWHWYINAWDSARPSIRVSRSCPRIELTCAIFLCAADDAFVYDASTKGNGCHHEGLDAQFDPHGLLFCSEGA